MFKFNSITIVILLVCPITRKEGKFLTSIARHALLIGIIFKNRTKVLPEVVVCLYHYANTRDVNGAGRGRGSQRGGAGAGDRPPSPTPRINTRLRPLPHIRTGIRFLLPVDLRVPVDIHGYPLEY